MAQYLSCTANKTGNMHPYLIQEKGLVTQVQVQVMLCMCACNFQCKEGGRHLYNIILTSKRIIFLVTLIALHNLSLLIK